jgi:hypothetical protein
MKDVALAHVTTYPAQHAQLEREMNKILQESGRRARINKVKQYLKAQIPGKKSGQRSRARTKTKS